MPITVYSMARKDLGEGGQKMPGTMDRVEQLLGVGLYSQAEAARYARISSSQKLSNWLFGTSKRPPVLKAQFEGLDSGPSHNVRKAPRGPCKLAQPPASARSTQRYSLSPACREWPRCEPCYRAMLTVSPSITGGGGRPSRRGPGTSGGRESRGPAGSRSRCRAR